MTPLALAVTAAASLFAGAALARALLGPARGWDERALTAAFAALLSLGLAGGCTVARVVAGLPWSAAALLFVLVGTAALRFRCDAGPSWPRFREPYSERQQGMLWTLFAAAALFFVCFLIEHHHRWPEGGYDGWAIWNTRARFLFRGGERAMFWPGILHPDYPFLVPALVAEGFWLLGREDLSVPGVVAGALAGLSALLLAAAVARLRGVSNGLAAGALLLATPGFLFYAWAQYVDGAVGAYVLAGAVAFVLALGGGDARASARRLALAGLCLSLAAWCKNEGALYLLVVLLALLLAGRRPLIERLRAAAALLAGAAPLLLLFLYYKLRLAPPNDLTSAQGHQTLARLLDPQRFLVIAAFFARMTLDARRWGLTLLAAPLALLLLWRARRQPQAVRALGVALGLCGLGFFLVYLTTPQELVWHLNSSAERLVLQLWPALLLLVALVVCPGEPVNEDA